MDQAIFDNPARQTLWFQRLRWHLVRNTLQMMFHRSLVRLASIFFCSLLVWTSLFTICLLGFRLLKNQWDFPLNGHLIGLTFDWLFVALTLLLIFSTGIILYSSLFSSAETLFLLAGPMRPDQIFAYKFQGAIGFSSWAFVLLASPILIAYGLEVGDGAPWYYYVVLPLFFIGFILLPGSLGALICLFLVHYLPRHRKQVLVLVLVVLTAILGLWIYRMWPRAEDPFSRDWVNRLLGEISLVRGPLMPAHWIADGLQMAAIGEVRDMLYNLSLVWANGLFFYVITAWLAGRSLRRGYNRAATGGTLRRRYGGAWMDNLLARMLFFLAPPKRLLIIKDFRTFRRDPAQWAQILIFLGLAVFYFSNIRRFYEQDVGKTFANGISLLNLVATSFLMCAYTGRFIYPMLSLEGRKFWILGLLPLERKNLLFAKFAFSASGCLVVGEFLVIFSNLMLQMPWYLIAVHVATMAILALGLSGLSVGLGACLPNFRESDPSKISVGFGGTLNLVAGLLLLVVVILLMAAPWHLVAGFERHQGFWIEWNWWVWAGTITGACIGLAATILPLRAGIRALEKMEF